MKINPKACPDRKSAQLDVQSQRIQQVMIEAERPDVIVMKGKRRDCFVDNWNVEQVFVTLGDMTSEYAYDGTPNWQVDLLK